MCVCVCIPAYVCVSLCCLWNGWQWLQIVGNLKLHKNWRVRLPLELGFQQPSLHTMFDQTLSESSHSSILAVVCFSLQIKMLTCSVAFTLLLMVYNGEIRELQGALLLLLLLLCCFPLPFHPLPFSHTHTAWLCCQVTSRGLPFIKDAAETKWKVNNGHDSVTVCAKQQQITKQSLKQTFLTTLLL